MKSFFILSYFVVCYLLFCRLCAVIQVMEAAFSIAKNTLMSSTDVSVVKFTNDDAKRIMSDSLIIQPGTVTKADNFVSYSDSIATIFYDTQYSKLFSAVFIRLSFIFRIHCESSCASRPSMARIY